MTKILIFLLFFIVYNNALLAMNNKPYHHLPDGTFRNPEGSPERKASFNWSYKVFNQEKRKLEMNIPSDHVVSKKEVLEIYDRFHRANKHKMVPIPVYKKE